MATDEERLAEDLLEGAESIAEWMFGDKSRRRRVYHMAEKTNFPAFKIGETLCARKSTIRQWIADQEQER